MTHVLDGALIRNDRGRVLVRCTCTECGDPFYAVRVDARYCENACRQAAYRRRQKTS